MTTPARQTCVAVRAAGGLLREVQHHRATWAADGCSTSVMEPAPRRPAVRSRCHGASWSMKRYAEGKPVTRGQIDASSTAVRRQRAAHAVSVTSSHLLRKVSDAGRAGGYAPDRQNDLRGADGEAQYRAAGLRDPRAPRSASCPVDGWAQLGKRLVPSLICERMQQS